MLNVDVDVDDIADADVGAIADADVNIMYLV